MIFADKNYRAKLAASLQALLNKFSHKQINLETPLSLVKNPANDTESARNFYQNPEKLLEALENISDAFYIVDDEDRFIHINKAAEPLLRQKRENLLGSNIWETYSPAKETLFYEKYYEAKKLQKAVRFEEYYEPFKIWTECRIYPGPDYVCAYFRDITELKRAEQERLQIGKLESLSILSGGLAHDFNNLLTTIMSNLALVRLAKQPAEITNAKTAPAKIDSYIAQAEKACLKAKTITHQLLTFSKGDQPNRKPLKIASLVEDAISFAMHGSNIECVFTLAGDLWEVEADSAQLEQVLQNLAINARYAMNNPNENENSQKFLTVSVQNSQITVPGASFSDEISRNGGSAAFPAIPVPPIAGSFVLIEVKDNGCGITPENIERIFDPYFTTKKDGNGIGLAVCYSIIRKHAGYIFVKSELNAGTTFYIYLPAYLKNQNESESSLTATTVNETTSLLRSNARPRFSRFSQQKSGRVLMMDDDLQLIEAVSELLKYMGYQVTTCHCGEEVIEIYRSAPTDFDVILLDLTIRGGMGGLEAIAKLQEINPQVKVLATSGYSDSELLKDYANYGFSGVVKKPYTIVELSHQLDSLLSQA